jgi:beta-glucosidase-like glycosyl hydrolase
MYLKGTVPIEIYKNRCLHYIEAVNKLKEVDAEAKTQAKQRIFNVYFKLQEYVGAERQENKQTFNTREDVEIPLETVGDLLDTAVADAYRRTQFAGGLGFSTSRGLTLSEGMGKQINNYWQPPKKSAPIMYVDCTTINYNSRETTQEWRDKMAAEKEAILSKPFKGMTFWDDKK